MDVFCGGSPVIDLTPGIVSTPHTLNGGGNYLRLTNHGSFDVIVSIGGADVVATLTTATLPNQNIVVMGGSEVARKLPVGLNQALCVASIIAGYEAQDQTGRLQIEQGDYGA